MLAPPETHYARADDGVHIAYQVFGDGPFDLVFAPGFISHMELVWEDPGLAAFSRHLGSFSRVIAFDKRGTGMSDRTESPPDIDRRMLDIEAVMAAAGSQEAAFFAVSEGGPMSILFAATHPEQTRALVLWGTWARMLKADDYPIGVPETALDGMADHLAPLWGTGAGLSAWAPSLAGDPAARDRFARLQRLGASPGAARALMSSYMKIDVRAALPLVHAPTLVLHRTGDRMVNVELGRYVAEQIPGARFVEVDGTDHFWWTQDGDRVLEETEEFLTGARPVVEPERILATVLFTDIVDSTRTAAEMGDRRWKAVLDQHDLMCARQVERHGGRVVNHTGDGILATFDGPARAVRCGQAITSGAQGLGIEVRAGVHTGEVEQRGEDIGGLGVHIGARVAALAGAGEVLVSRTVADLVIGSGLQFAEHGEHDLKGVPGTWSLFTVVQ